MFGQYLSILINMEVLPIYIYLYIPTSGDHTDLFKLGSAGVLRGEAWFGCFLAVEVCLGELGGTSPEGRRPQMALPSALTNIDQILTNIDKKWVKLLTTCLFQKAHVYKKKKAPAASPKRRNNGLGLPIHIKKVPILLNIRYYIILPIYSLLYIHYIQFPIRIRDFPSRIRDFPSMLKRKWRELRLRFGGVAGSSKALSATCMRLCLVASLSGFEPIYIYIYIYTYIYIPIYI